VAARDRHERPAVVADRDLAAPRELDLALPVVADIVDAPIRSQQERLIRAAETREQELAVRGAAIRRVDEPGENLPELTRDCLSALRRLRRVRGLHRELAHAVKTIADRDEHAFLLSEP